MLDLDAAIARLEAEVKELEQSQPGTVSWLLWQAKSLGLSFLVRAKQEGVDTPRAAEALRKVFRRAGQEEAQQAIAADRASA